MTDEEIKALHAYWESDEYKTWEMSGHKYLTDDPPYAVCNHKNWTFERMEECALVEHGWWISEIEV